MTRGYFLHVGDAIAEFLDNLHDELLDLAERHGPLRGLVRAKQRPYSIALDRLLEARESARPLDCLGRVHRKGECATR